MANKALGRDLGDLLSRARPARLVDRAGESGPRFGHRAEVSAPPAAPSPTQPHSVSVSESSLAAGAGGPRPMDLLGLAGPSGGSVATSPASATPAPGVKEAPLGGVIGETRGASANGAANGLGLGLGLGLGQSRASLPLGRVGSEPVRRSRWKVLFWAADAVLVLLAGVFAFGGFLGEPLGRILAVVALVLGGVFFWLGGQVPAAAAPTGAAGAPSPSPSVPHSGTGGGAGSVSVEPPSPAPSKIRVHLTRV